MTSCRFAPRFWALRVRLHVPAVFHNNNLISPKLLRAGWKPGGFPVFSASMQEALHLNGLVGELAEPTPAEQAENAERRIVARIKLPIGGLFVGALTSV